jgi:hypothetical protein
MLPREVHSCTLIAADGQPKAVIVARADGPFAQAAEDVRSAINEATGAQLAIKRPSEVTDNSETLPERARGLMILDAFKQVPLIMVGNLSVNPAMFEPHLRQWFVSNKESFAAGEFRLATFGNPWGTGAGICSLGAADQAGLARGAQAFKEIVTKYRQDNNLALPRVVAPGDDPLKASALGYKAMVRPTKQDWEPDFKQAKEMHLGYGDIRRLQAFTWLTDLGYLTAEEVCDVENEMLVNLLMIPQKVKWYRKGGTHLTDRHETYKNPRVVLACEHLLTVGRPNEAAKKALQEVARGSTDYLTYFARNADRCDHEDIMADNSWPNVIWFALLKGLWELFTSGLARQAAFNALLRTDNQGCLAGHNMYEGVNDSSLKSGARNVIRTAAWWYRDGRFRWLLENLPLSDNYNYSIPLNLPLDGIEPREPTEWLGAQAAPVSPHVFNEAQASPKWSKLDAPREQTADLITLRGGYGPDDQYLCMDGCQHQYQPRGLNCVLRYSDRGKLFLVATTGKEGNYYKSGVTVSRGLEETPEPWGIVKVAMANLGDVSLVASRVPDLNGTDWTRYIFWKRGAYFLFLDAIKANKPGMLNLTATWRTCSPATLENGVWRQDQEGVTFCLKPAFPLYQLAGQGLTDEYQNEFVPHLLRQNLSLPDAKAGDLAAFQNLIYATGPGDEQDFVARRLADGVCMVKGVRRRGDKAEEELALVGIRCPDLAELGIATDAEMVYLGKERAAFAGGSHLTLDGTDLVDGKGNGTAELTGKQKEMASVKLAGWWRKANNSLPHNEIRPLTQAAKRSWTFDGFKGCARQVRPASVVVSPDKREWTASFGREVDLDKVVHLSSAAQRAPFILEFSSDGFAKDIRAAAEPAQSVRVTGPFGKSFFTTHHLFTFPCQKASSVRVRTEAKAALESQFFEFCPKETDPPEIVRLSRVEGVGLLALTRDNQFVFLDSSGKPKWQHTFEHKPTSLEALDIDADGQNELVVADASGQLCVYSATGELKSKRLLKTEHPKMGDFFRSNRPYSLGLWQPDGKGVPSLVMGTYQSLAWMRPNGDPVCWPEEVQKSYRSGFLWRGLIYWEKVLRRGIDFNGDGVEDTAVLSRGWATPPTIGFFDGKSLEVLKEYPLPNGLPLGLEAVDFGGRPCVLAANEFHLGVYSVQGADEVWHVRFDTPASGYALLRQGDQTRIAVAKRDGLVLLLDTAGKPVQSRILSPELAAIAAAGNRLVVCSSQGLTFLDANLAPVGLNPGATRFLARPSDGLVVSDAGNGRLVAWSIKAGGN